MTIVRIKTSSPASQDAAVPDLPPHRAIVMRTIRI
jgi:hypothetical protein